MARGSGFSLPSKVSVRYRVFWHSYWVYRRTAESGACTDDALADPVQLHPAALGTGGTCPASKGSDSSSSLEPAEVCSQQRV